MKKRLLAAAMCAGLLAPMGMALPAEAQSREYNKNGLHIKASFTANGDVSRICKVKGPKDVHAYLRVYYSKVDNPNIVYVISDKSADGKCVRSGSGGSYDLRNGGRYYFEILWGKPGYIPNSTWVVWKEKA